MHKSQRFSKFSSKRGTGGYSLTHLYSTLPDSCYSARLKILDPADSASAGGVYIRCGRRNGLCLLGGRGRLPWCALVRHPTSAKEEKEHIDSISDDLPRATFGLRVSPRSKTRRCYPDNPHKRCTLLLSRTPYPQSPYYSRLSNFSDECLGQERSLTMTAIILRTTVVRNESHGIVRDHILWM